MEDFSKLTNEEISEKIKESKESCLKVLDDEIKFLQEIQIGIQKSEHPAKAAQKVLDKDLKTLIKTRFAISKSKLKN